MNKLRLHLDDLAVDSFDTSAVRPSGGTVLGEECTCPTACTCPGCPTCVPSCEASCGGTCNESECIVTCFHYDTCGGQGHTCWDSCGGSCWC